MDKVKFTCEVVSPMFMGGAYKRSLEFRPTELKASLRFWWRAMHAHLTLEQMKDKEANIFGSGNEKGVKSAIRILDFNIDNLEKKIDNKLPHKNKKWSEAPAYISGTFTITFGLANETIFNREQLIALMKIASYLGGLGARSRRGMGAWRITHIDKKTVELISDSLLQELLNNIEVFNSNYEKIVINNKKIIVLRNPVITDNYPYIREIYIGSGIPNLYRIPQKNLNDKMEKNFGSLMKKIIFLSHFIKKRINNFSDCAGNTKLSSPIYISILQDKEYYPVISFLNDKLENCDTVYEGFKLIL